MAIARNNNLSKSAKFFDSDGSLNLVEGSNITITKNATAGTITIASSGGGAGTVDSAFVTGLPVSTFSNDVQYLDSTTVQGVIDATYIQSNQTTYTNVSEFVNDANYLDSTTVTGVIDATYIQANQTTYNTADFTDSTYVNAQITTAINNLVDGAPGALDTLNELAAALNDDSQAYNTLLAQINGLPDSAWIQALPISTFSNDAQYLDSTTVQGVIDATYIQANQTTYDFLDSAEVIALIDSDYVNARVTPVDAGTDSATVVSIIGETVDSAYVRLRQDYAYSSLTGAPTALSSFANDTQYLDSTTVQYVIDGTYIQANQTVYTTLSEFANDTNYLDSTTVQNVINSAYVQNNQIKYNTSDFVDSAGVNTIVDAKVGVTILAHDSNLQDFVDTFTLPTSDGATNHVLLTNGSGTLSFASVASVSGATDSGDVRSLIDEVVDSAFVALHQDYAYANLTGAPTNVTSFINDANYLDSTTVQDVINSSYIQSNQTTYNTSDFLDSTTVYPLFSAGTGVTYNGSGQFSIGQAVGTTDSVTFAFLTTTGDVVVGGNLQVTGTTTTVNSEDLNVTDNIIYMNAGESAGSPTASIDVGWVANVNDQGSYYHVGLFRDATDQTFKVFHEYTPEPDASVEINTGHATFALAPFAASTLTGVYQGFDSDFGIKATTTNISTFINDVKYLDSTTVQGVINAAYIQANQTTYTNVSEFVNDANYLDSTTVQGVIDAAYIQANQTTYNTSDFLDSTTVSLVVDAAYVQARQTTYNTSDFVDSAGVNTLIAAQVGVSVQAYDSNLTDFVGTFTLPIIDGSINHVLSTNGSGTLSFISVASIGGGVDSGDVATIVTNTVDSAYIAARMSPALTNYEYTATSGQTTFTGSDDNGATLGYDAGKLQVFLNGVLLRNTDDYTATNGTSVVLGSGADSGDLVNMYTFGYTASAAGNETPIGLIENFDIVSTNYGGTINFNTTDKTLFYLSGGSDSTGFIPNFQNVNSTTGVSTTTAIVISQDSSPAVPTHLMIDSSLQTINWQNDGVPSGNALKKDIFTFTLMRIGSGSTDWIVLGSNSTYG